MDGLALTNQMRFDVARYCSKRLLDFVLHSFETNNSIIYSGSAGESVWEVTDFMESENIGITTKLAVITSFLYSGATIIYNNIEYPREFDRTKIDAVTGLLNALQLKRVITKEQSIVIAVAWMETRNIPQFDLDDNYNLRVTFSPIS